MSQSVDNCHIQARVVHCLGSWLAAYAIPQAYLVSSKLLCIPFSAMVLSSHTFIAMNRDVNDTGSFETENSKNWSRDISRLRPVSSF